MNKDEAIQVLESLTDDDRENAHIVADGCLTKWLRANGHSDLAEAWERAAVRVGFWYA